MDVDVVVEIMSLYLYISSHLPDLQPYNHPSPLSHHSVTHSLTFSHPIATLVLRCFPISLLLYTSPINLRCSSYLRSAWLLVDYSEEQRMETQRTEISGFQLTDCLLCVLWANLFFLYPNDLLPRCGIIDFPSPSSDYTSVCVCFYYWGPFKLHFHRLFCSILAPCHAVRFGVEINHLPSIPA